jgi:uncharacterized protein (DUF58 family)
VAVAAVLVVLVVAAATSRRSGLLLFVFVVALPLAAAPLLAMSRGVRARAARIRIMVAPPLVPVDSPCELIVQLANEGDTALPPLYLERPAEHSSPETSQPTRLVPPAPTRSRFSLAASPGGLLRWEVLRAHQSSSAVLGIPTRRRGVFGIGPLHLWAHDPFGLFGVPVATASRVKVVVHPPCAPSVAPHLVPVGSTGTGMPRDGDAQVHSDDPAGEWSGLRPYVPGDRLHLLSWPAEALYGALLVHEFRPDGRARIRIVLDDRAGVHRRRAFEEALSVIYAFLVDAAQHSFEIELEALSGDATIGSSSPEGMVDLLTFLARAQPRKGPTGARRATPERVLVGPSVVVTTSTALPTLPPSPGDPSVVVIE